MFGHVGQTIKRYRLLYVVGQGNQAIVWCAIHQTIKALVAIKLINKTTLNENSNLAKIRREIMIMKMNNHQNLIKLYEVIEDEEKIAIVMEYLNNGTLLNLMKHLNVLPEIRAKRYITQVLNGLDEMRSNNCVHRDIKAENIMLDSNDEIRIIDFGFSARGDIMSTGCGTPSYAAPEIYLDECYSNNVDVWSVGILTYYLITGKFPFDDENLPIMIQKIINDEPEFPTNVSTECVDFLKRALDKNPKTRLSTREALMHPWISHLHKLPSAECFVGDQLNEDVLSQLMKFGVIRTSLEYKISNGITDDDTIMYQILNDTNTINENSQKRRKSYARFPASTFANVGLSLLEKPKDRPIPLRRRNFNSRSMRSNKNIL